MRIHTKIVIGWDGKVLEEEGYDYYGPVAECKRNDVKGQATQQMQAYQNAALQNLGLQRGMLSPMTGYLQNMVTNPTGFGQDALAAMRTQAINNTASQFNPMIQQLKASLGSRGLTGGASPTSGIAGRDYGQLYAQEAGTQAQNLAGINIQNALQAQQNRWNAAGTLGNYAGILNPSAFVGGSGQALGDLTQLWTAPTIGGNIGTFWGELGAGAFKGK